MPREISNLIRYDRKGSEVVAVFYDRAAQEYFSLSKEECEKRQKDAQGNRYDHDQIDAALNGWPEQ